MMFSEEMEQTTPQEKNDRSPDSGDIGFKWLGAVLDCLEEATAICDFKGILLHVNQPFLHTFCPVDTDTEIFLKEETLEALLTASDGYVYQEGWWNELQSNGRSEFESCIDKENEGEKQIVVVDIRMVSVENYTLLLVTLRDLTRLKRLEFELETAKKSIEELANEVQSESLANMSHELRTPMHSILSCARLGFRKVDSASREKLKSYLEMIITSGDQLLILLNDLLTLTTPESSRAAYTLRERNLVEDLSRVVLEFQGMMEESDISLVYDPPLSIALACYDVTKLYQVMRNLLANAVKFTAPATTIRVTIQQGVIHRGELQRAAYKVSVIDQGVGLDREDLLHVFNKFTQGRKAKTGAGGVGLGLSICKRIIEGHEGVIWAEQNEEKGTTFSFLLPALE